MNPRYNGKVLTLAGMSQARQRNIVVPLPNTDGLVYCGDEIWQHVSFAEAQRRSLNLDADMQEGWWEPALDLSDPIHHAAATMSPSRTIKRAAATLQKLIEYGRGVLAKREKEGKIR